MLISVRDKNKKLLIKDVLDIDFDMYVAEENNIYYVYVNKLLRLDEQFNDQSTAEEAMIHIADVRNKIEAELRSY